MRNPFRHEGETKRDDTRSHEWDSVGLAQQVDQQAIRKARWQALILLILLVGVVVVYWHRRTLFGHIDTPVRIGAAIAVAVIGWALARDIGHAAAPTFFRRMEPATAGTVGFLIRLATVAITLLGALAMLAVPLPTLALGGSIMAIVIGLAAQQTLGNLFAGMVLLSARPFQVGMRVRLQAGQLAGSIDGVISSLGLLYTTLARGQDKVMIPNSIVLSSVVVPVLEPDPVDVKVRLHRRISATTIQAMLDHGITTPTRRDPQVLLHEIDGDEVVVRIQATPERAGDGAALADEIIAAVDPATAEHEAAPAAQ